MRRAVCLAAVALAGCGSAVPAVAPIRLPAQAAEACERIAASELAPVLCPPREGAPETLVRLIHEDLNADPCVFVQNLQAREHESDGRRPSHVLYGAACEPFPLDVRPDGRWDIEPPASLRLAGSPPLVLGQPPRASLPHVVARVRVRGNPGLLVRADPFPEGGTNGSYYGLAWNENGASYQVSAHYATGDRGLDPAPYQRRALMERAASLR